MTYAEAFSKIKKKLGKASVKGQDFAIQVTITDDDAAGTFYVANIGGAFSVEPYDYKDNTVAIDIAVANFIKLVEGKLKIDKALASGKLGAFGDTAAIELISGIVKPATRKTAAKKEAPQKNEEKSKAVKKLAEKIEPPKKAEEKSKAVKKSAEKKEAPKKESVKKTAPKSVASKKEEKAPAMAESLVVQPKAEITKPADKKTAKKADK